MLLQITYQDKAIQTDIIEDDALEKLFKTLTTLLMKVDNMGNEIEKLKTNEVKLKFKAMNQLTQQCAELCRSENIKISELKGDVGTLHKTHNIYQSTIAGTSKGVIGQRYQNMNLNKTFEKPFTQKIQKDLLYIPPQITTYRDSLNQDKKAYNHIARGYIENIYKVQTFLNLNPRATDIKGPNTNYITQRLQGHNKLIALPQNQPKLNKNLF